MAERDDKTPPADASRAERPCQLTFDLAAEPCYDQNEFLLSTSNAQAHAMITAWPGWADRVLLLIGAAGSGKSHLGAIWAARAGARTIRHAADLDVSAWQGPPRVLIEDCDRAAFAEHELFHLLNVTKERSGWLLVTSRAPPDRWTIKTPDLLSRLRLAATVSIKQPDAALLRAVLVKLFIDRQIRIDEEVLRYAALHCEQSLQAMRRFVSAIDAASLASGRRITRPLVSETIAKLDAE